VSIGFLNRRLVLNYLPVLAVKTNADNYNSHAAFIASLLLRLSQFISQLKPSML